MVVAVIAVTVMQAPIDQVVKVVTVGHQRMAAALVAALAHHRGASVRVCLTHGEHMLIVVALVGMVQVAIVEVVHMAVVLDAQMATVLAVDVRVVGVGLVSHDRLSFRYCLLREEPV
jgi:hypothetical protein